MPGRTYGLVYLWSPEIGWICTVQMDPAQPLTTAVDELDHLVQTYQIAHDLSEVSRARISLFDG